MSLLWLKIPNFLVYFSSRQKVPISVCSTAFEHCSVCILFPFQLNLEWRKSGERQLCSKVTVRCRAIIFSMKVRHTVSDDEEHAELVLLLFVDKISAVNK